MLSSILRRQAETRAKGIAREAHEGFVDATSTALAQAHDAINLEQFEAWEKPRSWPAWIDGLYLWNGNQVDIVEKAERSSIEIINLIETRLAARDLPVPSSEEVRKIEILYEMLGDMPVVLACAGSVQANQKTRLLVARVDLEILRNQLVEPLIVPGDGLELVEASRTDDATWSQPLFSATRFWKLRLTEESLEEQANLVVRQTLFQLILTVLALGTLLAAMWFLTRVSKREVALAEMKSNFVADVSHELKTPLAVIRLYAETLQSGRITSDAKKQDYFDTIMRESTRLSNMINNILDFARIEAGRAEFSMALTDVGAVVRETYEAYCPELERQGFEHELSLEKPMPMIEADRDAITQILFNLMRNALKYSGDDRYMGVEVTTDTQRDRRGVVISVHDRGIGIRPEDRAHLFNGFYRADDERVREKGGVGLGLALVKHIVDAHHGSIDVESRLVVGTTFRIFLPAAEPPPAADESPRVSAGEAT